MNKYLRYILLLAAGTSLTNSAHCNIPEFSKAGFYELENSGREVYNFNLDWRFMKGDAAGAEQPGFDDSEWEAVNCPHTLEYTPSEASGSCNYQGPAWYRKHFTVDDGLKDRVLKLHFEAVMGKCKVWLNGAQIGEHFGGYLPFVVDLNENMIRDGKNILAVWADNSDDPSYPPGKPQTELDFTYFGGIYRDVWLVSTGRTYITNPNDVDKVAGGGVFVSISELTESRAVVRIDVDVNNEGERSRKLQAEISLIDPEGNMAARASGNISVKQGRSASFSKTLEVSDPELWSPWSPDLYRLEILLTDAEANSVDGVALRVGLRKIEFRGKDGFFLNNKPYPGKLMGANRHQDHAYVGYAIPNNGQWRDAKLLKDAACDIVRAGHYPADPAFMDACDELGIFFIVATPGWQYWNNDDPLFEQRLYEDIRNMVRRDRNHASVIMWEPILNETRNPDRVTLNGHKLVHEEYPYQGAFTACDQITAGHQVYDVLFTHAENDHTGMEKCLFQREFGSVSSANTPNRMHSDWGEHALKFQAEQYAKSSFDKGSLDLIHSLPAQFVGGCLWHSFDHFAGKHARPFYGGIVDAFRQPKYSYYLFASQRDVSETTGPMVYLAHELSPFSPADVNVFTNCEEVRLTVDEGIRSYQKTAVLDYRVRSHTRKRSWDNPDAIRAWEDVSENYMPHPIVKFEDAYDYVASFKHYELSSGKPARSGMLVEGLIDGKVVVSEFKRPALNGQQLKLKLVDRGVPLAADGSDFVLVMAYVVDKNGTLVRFHENTVKFEVSGEGAIIGDESIAANPRRMEWGTAPLLVRSTTKPGKIRIRVSLLHPGPNTIQGGELIIESLASDERFIQSEYGKE